MAKEIPNTAPDPVITITPEQEDEHKRREKIAAGRNKKLTEPNDSARPATEPSTEPVSVVDTAQPATQGTSAGPASKKTATRKR